MKSAPLHLRMRHSWRDPLSQVRYVRNSERRKWQLEPPFFDAGETTLNFDDETSSPNPAAILVDQVNAIYPQGFSNRARARAALVSAYHSRNTHHAQNCKGDCFLLPVRRLAGWDLVGIPYAIYRHPTGGWGARWTNCSLINVESTNEYHAFQQIFDSIAFPTRGVAVSEIVMWRDAYQRGGTGLCEGTADAY